MTRKNQVMQKPADKEDTKTTTRTKKAYDYYYEGEGDGESGDDSTIAAGEAC